MNKQSATEAIMCILDACSPEVRNEVLSNIYNNKKRVKKRNRLVSKIEAKEHLLRNLFNQ